MNEPLVYIILLVWNGYKDTIECITSLQKITYKNYKILIIDNASTNNSAEILEKSFPQYKLIRNSKNLGFSGGCNIGIKYALKNKADYILLLNNDTTVDKNFLQELIKVGEEDGKIGILSPFIYYKDRTDIIWSSGLFLDLKKGWPFSDINQNKLDHGQFKTTRKVDFLTGCCMLIKKEVFNKVGLFREEYFLYFEDSDFSIRAKKQEFALVSIPSSKIWHKIGQSSQSDGLANIRYYFARNLLLFFRFNFGFKQQLYGYIYSLYLKTIEIINYLKKGDLQTSKGILLGIFHGFLGKYGQYK